MLDNLTIIIPFRNGHATLGRLLDSLPANLPVLIVDDVSNPRPVVAPEHLPHVRGLYLRQRGYFAGAVNAGLVNCDTDVLVLNQDVSFEWDGWQRFIEQNREAGIAGDGVMGHPAWPKGYVQGTFMYLSRAAIAAVGPFNELDFPLWGTTAEWQVRACRKGFRAVPATVPGLVHERREARYGSAITQALREEPSEAGRFIRTPPLISVVIPNHNYGRYLPDLVHSLIGGQTCLGEMTGQTLQAFELIIVDDASTDDSWQIAQSLADPWMGIHAYRMPQNGGTAAAMNYGIERSYGRYIMAMDADDMLEAEALEIFYGVISDDAHSVPYCDQQIIADGKRALKPGTGQPDIWTMQEYDFERLLKRNQVPAGIMFSREAWTAAGRYPEAMRWGRQDWAFAVALGQAGYCGLRVPKPLYLYRREGQNRTLRNSDPQWRETFTQQMRDLFPALYRGERPMGCCGGSRRPPQAQRAPAQTARVGQMTAIQGAARQGMVMMEYIGQNAGETSWWGHATSMQYRFGPRRRVSYVYESDVPGFLNARQGRQVVFRLYVQPTAEYDEPGPPPVPAAVTPPPVKAQEELKAEPVVEQPDPEQVGHPVAVIFKDGTVDIVTPKPKRKRSKKDGA